jgi:hypothetical protein
MTGCRGAFVRGNSSNRLLNQMLRTLGQALGSTRETGALHDPPVQAVRAAMEGVALCEQAAGAIKGLIRADIEASTALLQGAAAAIAACVAANREAMSP